MTDQLSRPAPPFHRCARPSDSAGGCCTAGIVNVWEYDRAELSFAGGRVLLRGSNGAGKSKALEVLLPFLLDGDTRAIDATGRDRTSVYWLMTDRREAGTHVGYVWLELRMTGARRTAGQAGPIPHYRRWDEGGDVDTPSSDVVFHDRGRPGSGSSSTSGRTSRSSASGTRSERTR